MNTVNWMERLASHYEVMRSRYPEEKLIILFDIDGTILDARYLVLSVLQSYDAAHGTTYFRDLRISEVTTHEDNVRELLARLGLPTADRERIAAWYERVYWSPEAVLRAHRPFSGVMEVMRWFQIQPNTFVGLNTGRPEAIRAGTLDCLNELGKEYKVNFTSDLLHMKPDPRDRSVPQVKAAGILRFQRAGYRVFAAVDNEPANLAAIAEVDPSYEIMLLHADTIFESQRKALPPHSVSGDVYDLTHLAQETDLPRHVQLVWHGINDARNLRQFLASNLAWGEADVRLDPASEQLVLRHDPLDGAHPCRRQDLLPLQDVLESVGAFGKSIKLDLKEGGSVIHESLAALRAAGFDDSRVWFNANANVLGREGFAVLQDAYPSAIIQSAIDSMVPILLNRPEEGLELLEELRSWGINRVSVKWNTPEMSRLVEQLDSWGFETNIYNVPDLKAFLKAALLLPRSITSDFNFPQWHYFGRGSGEEGKYHEYSIKSEALLTK